MTSNLPTLKKPDSSAQSPTVPSQFLVGGVDLRPWDAQVSRVSDEARYFRSVLVGLLAATVASLLYAGFTIASHIEIGIAAVGVGFVVGKAMMEASYGAGGPKYQMAAVVLTYFSVSMARVPEVLWQWRARGVDIAHLTSEQIFTLAKYGVASPFFDLTSGIGVGLISFLILSFGIQQAWRLTAAAYSA
jgi:hypothetical protein